jgi:hypothetical protein
MFVDVEFEGGLQYLYVRLGTFRDAYQAGTKWQLSYGRYGLEVLSRYNEFPFLIQASF